MTQTGGAVSDAPSDGPVDVPGFGVAVIRRRIAFTMLTVAVAYLCIGASLLLQPDRWYRAAGYANLLATATTISWGSAYVLIGAVMAFAVFRPQYRIGQVVAHTAGIAVALAWLIGFVIRYLTDPNTTVMAVVPWATFLALLIRSAVVLDDDREPPYVTVKKG